jgi:hypothetical protein
LIRFRHTWNRWSRVSVDIRSANSQGDIWVFDVGRGPYPSNQGWTRPRSYDVTPDGERFLLTKLPGEQPEPRIVVVLNWFEELLAKVPR